jgi:hypothetical protein
VSVIDNSTLRKPGEVGVGTINHPLKREPFVKSVIIEMTSPSFLKGEGKP